jgi:hypothetical protein
MSLKYASWTLLEEKDGYGYIAVSNQGITVSLNTDGEFLWGWWPSEPAKDGHMTVVAGICLFDARWRVEFKNPKPGQRGAIRSLALTREREEAEELLKRGREIKRILYPPFPTPYAKMIVDWQKWGLKKLLDKVRVKRVSYHIPLQEYLYFCSILPSPWRESMEAVVINEAQKIEELVSKELSAWPIEIHWGGSNPPQSFVDLYVISIEDGGTVIGLEELVELRLTLEAKRQTGRTIPTLVGVLGLPHPYFRPPKEEVIELEL